MKKATYLVVCLMLTCCYSLSAQLLDTSGDLTTNDVALRSFKFKADAGNIVLRISVATRPGTVGFEVRSPAGSVIGRQSAGVATINDWSLTVTNGGDCELVVTPHQTAGHWQVRIDKIPGLGALYQQIASGAFEALLLGLGASLGSLVALASGQTQLALKSLRRLLGLETRRGMRAKHCTRRAHG